MSTLEAYFQGRRDLFAGLAIEQLDMRKKWDAHPVIRLDLSQFKGGDEQVFAEKFDRLLSPYEERYGVTRPAKTPGVRLDAVIGAAATNDGENGVVVLVDEYDAPLLGMMHDPEGLERHREIMREFYSPLKANEAKLAFVLLTGISKFSQLSIFSELNNLLVMSTLPEFAGVCGITAQELDGPLAPDVAYLADRLDVTPQACRAQLKDMYDGYRFSKEPAEIYNPYSLVTALNNADISPYWFGTGTPTSLVNMLRRADVTLPELEGVEATETSFDAPTEAMSDPVAFMYQSGYLTIKDYDRLLRTYTLGIPNAEVAEGLSRALLPLCAGTTPVQNDGFVARFARALLYDDDMDDALRQLRAFLAGIPYDLAAKREKDFQAQVYLILRLVGAVIRTEVSIATGRIDVLIDASRTLYVMELKYRRAGQSTPTSADAARQIGEKGYSLPYETGGKPVTKVGVAYSEERRTIDEDWVIDRA